MEMSTAIREHSAAVHGVRGRMMSKTAWSANPSLFSNQTWISEGRKIGGFGAGGRLTVWLSFQDNPRNGHNTFHATGVIMTTEAKKHRDIAASGMLHEEIAAIFPEIAHLLKWHGVSTDGPCHYLANTVYLAGDKDCRGLRTGEPWAFNDCVQFGDNPVKHALKSRRFVAFLQNCVSLNGGNRFDLEVIRYDHSDRETYRPKFTYGGYANAWHECPFDTEREALDFLYALQNCSPKFVRVSTIFSKGKQRELDGARRTAVWPDATDDDLMAEPDDLRAALVARLPKLLGEFKRDILAAGFLWELT
jgi:hypothetical protein